jgi:hypothetical protein
MRGSSAAAKAEARSYAKGVALYDSVLRDWRRVRTRDRGLYLARLAMACANAGAEPDCSGWQALG